MNTSYAQKLSPLNIGNAEQELHFLVLEFAFPCRIISPQESVEANTSILKIRLVQR